MKTDELCVELAKSGTPKHVLDALKQLSPDAETALDLADEEVAAAAHEKSGKHPVVTGGTIVKGKMILIEGEWPLDHHPTLAECVEVILTHEKRARKKPVQTPAPKPPAE